MAQNSSSPDRIVKDKDAFRSMLFQRRRDLPVAERDEQSEQITEQLIGWFKHQLAHGELPYQTVCATLAFATEPDTDEVLRFLVDAGITIYVPISLKSSEMQWVHWYPGIDMEPSDFGSMREPVGPRLTSLELPPVDVVLVPALAVDFLGYRMGKGGGYYDRFLAELTSDDSSQPSTPKLITPLYTHEFLSDCSRVPREDHDLPVQAVVTPLGIRWIRDA